METSKKALLQPFVVLFDWHTQSFMNVIEGISYADAQNRLNSPANHIAWLAGSLVFERYYLGQLLGLDVKQTSESLFENHKGIQDAVSYPSLDEYRGDWQRISPALHDRLVHLEDSDLSEPDPFEMPGGPYTLFEAITFCLDRESYCIGQIGLYRRLLGYPPMKYS